MHSESYNVIEMSEMRVIIKSYHYACRCLQYAQLMAT